MAEGDFLDDRRRASEEDYFRKKDRELVEKMRKAAAADRAQGELSAKTGLHDPAMICGTRRARLHARDDQRPPARADRPDGVGRRRHHAGRAHAPRQARARAGDCGGKRRGSATLRMDGSSAVGRCVRARHSAHSSDARHGIGRSRHDSAPTISSSTARASPPPRAASSESAKSRRRNARRSPGSWRR